MRPEVVQGSALMHEIRETFGKVVIFCQSFLNLSGNKVVHFYWIAWTDEEDVSSLDMFGEYFTSYPQASESAQFHLYSVGKRINQTENIYA